MAWKPLFSRLGRVLLRGVTQQGTSRGKPRRQGFQPLVEGLESRELLAASIAINDISLAESSSGTIEAIFTVTRSGDLSSEVTVGFATAAGTATAGSGGTPASWDFESATGSVTFLSDETTKTVSIDVRGDDLVEADETFFVNLTCADPNVVLADPSGQATVLNDDTQPIVSLAASTFSVVEGQTLQVDVSLSRTYSQEVRVLFRTDDGTARDGVEFTGAKKELVFQPGQTSKSVNLPTLGNLVDNDDLGFGVTLASPSGGAALGTASATVTIQDDEPTPTFSFSVAGSVSESDKFKEISVALSGKSTKTVSVDYSVSSQSGVGFAQVDVDFIPASGTLVFRPGQAVQTFKVFLFDDDLDEVDETINLRLSNAVNGIIGPGQNPVLDSTLTIVDNDDAPTVGFSYRQYSVGESFGSVVPFEISLSRPSSKTITVDLGASVGNFTVSTGTITFQPGQTTAFFTASTESDSILEPDSSGTLTLSAPTNASLGQATSTLWVFDDEATYTPHAALTHDVFPVIYESEAYAFEVRYKIRSDADIPSYPFTVPYVVLEKTATVDGDVQSPLTGTLTFESAEDTASLFLPGQGDTIYEGTENLAYWVYRSDQGAFGLMSGIWLTDNDPPPTFAFEEDEYSVEEDEGYVTVNVVLVDGAAERPYSVAYHTVAETATGGIDFSGGTGSLTFYPGETSKKISIPVRNDAQPEAVESYRVVFDSNLSTPTRVLILDDDTADVNTTGGGYHVGDISPETGNIRLTVPCDCISCCGDVVSSKLGKPQMVYNSNTANPRPLFAQALNTNAEHMPTSVQTRLQIGGIWQPQQSYTSADRAPGAPYQLVAQDSSAALPTGRHRYRMEVQSEFSTGAPETETRSGYVIVVNHSDSPLGAGWSVATADRLFPDDDGVLLVRGTGEATYYQRSGDIFFSPSDPSYIRLENGVYTHRSGGLVYTYAANGFLQEIADPTGESSRTYTWNNGVPATIQGTDGLDYQFTMQQGRVADIELTGGRHMPLTHNASGHLTRVGMPAAAPIDYTYTADGKVLSEQGPTLKTFTIDGDSHMALGSSRAGVPTTVDPAYRKGLPGRPAAQPSDAVGEVFTGQGLPARYQFSADHHLTHFTAANGAVEQWTRDASGQATQYIDPLTRATSYAYTPDGQVESIQHPDGAVEITRYHPVTGKPTLQIDALGNQTRNDYTEAGVLTGSRDALGNATSYVVNTGLVQSVTDPLGRTTQLGYNAFRQVNSVTDAAGLTTSYTHDAAGNRTGVANPDGSSATMIYDGLRRLVESQSSDGSHVRYTYVGWNLATEEDLQNNRITTHLYDAFGREIETIDYLGHSTYQAYDARGRLASTTDPFGNSTSYVYDEMDRVILTIDPYGFSSETIYDAAGQVITSIDPFGNETHYQYDSRGRQVAVIDADGNQATTTYNQAGQVIATTDPYGNVTTYSYDSLGRQVLVIDPYGHASQTRYDASGAVVEQIDILGHSTHYLYDAAGRQTGTIDIHGHQTSVSFNALGQVVSTTDVFGQATTYGYDAVGRQVSVLDSLGNLTETVFDAAGRVVEVVDPLGNSTFTQYDTYGRPVVTINPLGHATQTVYDLYGRPATILDALGHATTTLYDALGRHSATVDPLGNTTTTLYDNRGRPYATVNALGHATTTLYDARGRYSATVDALGNATTTLYDNRGRPHSTVNALGHATTTEFDARGRVSATVNPLGQSTNYLYDDFGRQYATVDPLGYPTTTQFDVFGRPVATVNPLGNVTQTVYDLYGRVAATIDANGGQVTYGYDTHNRRVSLTDPVGNTTLFVHDSLGREIEQIDPLGKSATFTYDPVGHLLSTTDRLGRRRDFAYDAVGRKTGESWYAPDGVTLVDQLSHTYDAVGRELTASNSAGTYVKTVDALGQVTQVAQPNGVTLNFTYDAVGRRVRVQDSLGGDETSIYDAVGQLLTRMQTTQIVSGPGASTLTGHFFDDLDGNGIQDAGEPGLANVCVNLVPAGETNPVAWTLSDADGDFSLSTLEPAFHLTFTSGNRVFPTGTGLAWTTTSGFQAATETTEGSRSWTVGLLSTSLVSVPITGHFYDDLNGNGMQDMSEPGLANVCVTVISAVTGNAVAWANSDFDGNFSLTTTEPFYHLRVEKYDRYLPLNAGLTWEDTTAHAGKTQTVAGASTWNIGLLTSLPGAVTSSVYAHFFDDLDADGLQDMGEPNLANICVLLYRAGTWFNLGWAMSDSFGNVSFTTNETSYHLYLNLPPAGRQFPVNAGLAWQNSEGTYALSETMQGSRMLSYGLVPPTSGGGGDAIVSGFFFDDANGNGYHDGPEGGVANVCVALYAFDQTMPSAWATTDAFGSFSLTTTHDKYHLSFTTYGRFFPTNTDLQWQYGSAASVLTGTGQGSRSWTVGLLNSVPGPIAPMSSVSGQFYDDANGNGMQDMGESGLANICVQLYRAGSYSPSGYAMTDANGNFSLTTTEEAYHLTFSNLGGKKFPLNAGYYWDDYSGTSASTGTAVGSRSFTAGLLGSVNPSGYAGSPITGTFFSDANNNGFQDMGEAGIANVWVYVYSVTSTGTGFHGYAQSDASGAFSTTAPDGNYYLSFSAWGIPNRFPANDDLRWSYPSGIFANSGNRFGASNWLVAMPITTPSIYGTLFDDLNANGMQDMGETGISNACVSVYEERPEGTLFYDYVQANANGQFSLPAPAYGKYHLEIYTWTGTTVLPPNAGLRWNTWGNGTSGQSGTRTGYSYWNIGLVNPASGGGDGGPPTSVTGRFFDDLDGDGMQGMYEYGLASVCVSLYTLEGMGFSYFGSTMTDMYGDYSMSAPAGKKYYVTYATMNPGLRMPANAGLHWTSESGYSAQSETRQGSFHDVVGLVATGSGPTTNLVSAHFYDDANGNGMQDPGETGLANVCVMLYPAGSTSSGVWAQSDMYGNVSLTTNLASYQLWLYYYGRVFPVNAGLHWAWGDGHAAYTESVSGSRSWTVGLRASAGSGTPMVASGQAFDDLNEDGVQDMGESGLANVCVTLWTFRPGDANPAYAGYAQADANGDFSLSVPGGVKYYLSLMTWGSPKIFPTNRGLRWLNSSGSYAETTTQDDSNFFSIGMRPPLEEPGPTTVELRADYTYDPAGRVIAEAKYSDANATNLVSSTTRDYTTRGEIARIWHKNPAGGTVADFQYQYDQHGRLTSESRNGVAKTYQYDLTDQLTSDNGTNYTWDPNGNRTINGYVTGQDNRLLSDGMWDYTYNDEGNMTGKEEIAGDIKWEYHFDHRNQLVKVEKKSNGTDIDLRVEYKYDVWGNRTEKSVDLDGNGPALADIIKFVIDGWNPAKPAPIGNENVDVLADLNADGSLKTHYLRTDRVDELAARIDAVGMHPGAYWYLPDHLGSIREVLDNAGVIKDSIIHDVFGNIISETDAEYRGRYGWTGREIEAEIDLQFNRARFYDPAIGRWISKDPLGFGAGDVNLYRYVNNSPVNWIDPSGYEYTVSGGTVQYSAKDGSTWSFPTLLLPSVLEAEKKAGKTLGAFQLLSIVGWVSVQRRAFVSITKEWVFAPTLPRLAPGHEVYLCRRVADLPLGEFAFREFDAHHEWVIVIDPNGEKISAGLGGSRGVPNAENMSYPDIPYISPVYIIDHSGEPEDKKILQNYIDVEALKSHLTLGEFRGVWALGLNDCNTVARGAIRDSTPELRYMGEGKGHRWTVYVRDENGHKRLRESGPIVDYSHRPRPLQK